MTHNETKRLFDYYYAAKRRFIPAFTPPSRRSAKAKRNATGQMHLKTFRIKHHVSLERVFVERK